MKYTLKVDGMNCGHCEGRVKNAVSELDQVTFISVSAANGTVEFEAEETLLGRVKDAIEDAGYDVRD